MIIKCPNCSHEFERQQYTHKGACFATHRRKEWNEYHDKWWYPAKAQIKFNSFEEAADFVISENAKIQAAIASGSEEGKKLAESEDRYELADRWSDRFSAYVKAKNDLGHRE